MSKFEDTVSFIKKKIESGEWPPGTWLPSQAEWAILGVKYGTLRSAYIVLKSQGLIVGHQGDGVYVAGAEPSTPSKAGGRGRLKKFTASDNPVRFGNHSYLDEAGVVQFHEGHYSGDGCIRRYGA